MLRNDGFVIAINHEPLSFLRRAGYAGRSAEREFLDDHWEENVKKLAENGCDMIRMHYYKGSGFQCEKEEIEMAKEYARLCHKYGIRVQLYVQFGTLAGETMLAEQPDMMDWIQLDENGKPITLLYGQQTFRYYPCINKEGYWDYLEGVLKYGLDVIGGDLIGFDNVTTSEEPFVCHCESCKKAFVQYLKEKYRPGTAEGDKRTKERFGHTILDFITPPVWNYFVHPMNLTAVNNPVIQEWMLFRCESLKKVMTRLYDYCKRLKPDVVLEYNTYKHFGTNTAFIHGVYVPDFKDCMDAFWNECDPFPGYTADGRLLNKIRSYKMGRAMEKIVFTGAPATDSVSEKMLAYAETMVFNHGIINGVEGARNIYKGRATEFQKYKDFRKKHGEIYNTKTLAKVALYESKASLSFNNYETYYAAITMHQGLIGGHIPYDLIFDLDSISKYKLIVLPDCECLSDEETGLLKAYVQNGGGLLLTDNTGEYDEWRRRRDNNDSLLQILGIAGERWANLHKAELGKGRVVYIPKFKSSRVFEPEQQTFEAFKPNQPMITPEYWGMPVNLESMTEAMGWASFDSIPFELDAPPYVVAELQIKNSGGGYCLHLLNYKTDGEIHNLRVKFNRNSGMKWDEVKALSPDTGEEYTLKVGKDGWLAVPPLKCYLILCF